MNLVLCNRCVPRKTYSKVWFRQPSIAFSNIVKNNTQKQRFKVGVFGAGRIASTVHIPNILKDRRFDLKWIVDDNVKQSSKVQRDLHLNDVLFCSSEKRIELLKDESLDAVFIFASTPCHAELITDSLTHGKSVMVEKPTAESFSEVKSCYELAERKGKVLLTGFQRLGFAHLHFFVSLRLDLTDVKLIEFFPLVNRRFDIGYSDLWTSINTRKLGDLQMLKLTSRDCPKSPYEYLANTDKLGCHIISDVCVHDFDMMVWMTSCAEPESIYAVTHTHDQQLKKTGQPDTVVLVVKFKNGLIAIIDTTLEASYGYDMRAEAFGSHGMAKTDNIRTSPVVIDCASSSTIPPIFYSFPQRFEKAFEAEISHFYDCLQGTTSPLITKGECLLVSRMIDKSLESYRKGQIVNFDH